MEYRRVGNSGLVVSELSFGAATFGGSGSSSALGVTRTSNKRGAMVDLCLEAGINLFDTADVYSDGAFGGGAGRRRSWGGAIRC